MASNRRERGFEDHRDALEALGDYVVSIDPAAQQVRWCTAAVTRRFPAWRSGASLTELAAGCEGLSAVLDGLVGQQRCSGTVHMRPGEGSPTVFDVQAIRSGNGAVYMRMTDTEEQQHATSRHLSDREQLLFISRSMSVGEMASTLAHELNQPIGAITNLLRGLLNRMDRAALDPATARAAVQRGIDQAMYASGIITRIREFVQARQPRQESVELATFARNAIDLLDWEMRRDDVRLSLDLPEGLPPVLGDAVMLQQVIVNLARNGLDAMRHSEPARRQLGVAAEIDDGMVVLHLSDGGTGLSPEAAARMFTPFFTTKPAGMGVGLNICRSIIELHRGKLWYTQNTDGGCTFHVALPIDTTAQQPSSPLPKLEHEAQS
jgi:two-component system, LuxR family, sensor kinase FixL